MRFATVLVAGFVAATSAVLLPPHIHKDVKDSRWKGGPPQHVKELFQALLEQKPTIVDLNCPECPFAAEDNGEIVWVDGIENAIHLEFATRDQTFSLNGHPLFPFEKAQQARSTIIKTYQIQKDSNQRSAETSLNFAMEVMPAMPSPHKDGVFMIPVEFTVLGLNGVPVKVNTLSFKIIQTPTGDLVIVKHHEIPFEETPGADLCEGAKPWSLCRLRAIIMSHMKPIMDLAKDKTIEAHGWVQGHCGKGRKSHGFGRPHRDGEHAHPHSNHRHGRHGPFRYHRVGHMIHQTLRFFIVPALLGVLGGLVASAIGMLVGQAIGFLWFRTYRRGQRGPLRLAETEVLVVSDEKVGLLEEEETSLPKYEDLPQSETTFALGDEKQ